MNLGTAEIVSTKGVNLQCASGAYVGRVQKIVIQNWHPVTDNQLMNSHYLRRHKLKLKDAITIQVASLHLRPATGKRKVEVTVTLGPKQKKKVDPFAYWKSLLDALVNAKMLVDDSDKWAQVEPLKYERGERRTLIVLTDLEEKDDG